MAKSVIGLLFVAALALAAPTPTQNIVQLAADIPDLSTLVTALKAGNLVTALSGAGPFTVFAPTNEAFAALPQATLKSLLEPKNIQQLQSIIEYHVISGAAVRAEDLKASQNVKTLEGQEVHINKIAGSVTVQNAKVIQADVGATNGVVHVINGVLTPPTALGSSVASAKTVISSLFGLAAAVDFNAGLPKPDPIIDTDKYETVADTRVVALYQRHMKTSCSYPNFTFDCTNLPEDIKPQVSTLKCLACQPGQTRWGPFGIRVYWLINYCAKDASSHVQVYYNDEACQVPVSTIFYKYTAGGTLIHDQPMFQNITASDANRNCFTGTTDDNLRCRDDLDICGSSPPSLVSNAPVVQIRCGSGKLSDSGQCPTSRPARQCRINDYCSDEACDIATCGCSCDCAGNATTCGDSVCCETVPGHGDMSIAAYEWWYEVRSSSPYTPSSSHYMCKNNQCVVATSGGGSYADCSKFCQGAIAV